MSKPKPTMAELAWYAPRLEKIAVFLLIVSVVLNMADIQLEALTIVGLLSLALAFFISSFGRLDMPPDENEKVGFNELLAWSIIPKVLWISSSISTIGILFYILQLEGYQQMLLTGGITITICFAILILLTFFKVKHLNAVTPILFRALPLLLADYYFIY